MSIVRWANLASELKPAMLFFAIVNKIAERAQARGDLGEGGGYVWDLAEWRRFCRAAREEKHLGLTGSAVFKTVVNVEQMLAEGKSAREIHAALYWRSRKDDSESEKRQAEMRAQEARGAAAAFESSVQEKLKDERARAEARRRVREESDDKPSSRRVAV